MNLEKNRLLTFSRWPSSAPINSERLARAGFYYNGNGLEVSCFSCNGKISDWFYGDQAYEKHRRTFPGCKFVLGKSNNEPFISSLGRSSFHDVKNIEQRPSSGIAPKPLTASSYRNDVNSQSCITSEYNCSNKILPFSRSTIDSVHCSYNHLSGIDSPVNQQYLRETNRLTTFANWTIPFIDKHQLAAAGFFYFGCEDKVQCTFCDGILGIWEPNDIPIDEHRKHFPHCRFVQGMDVGNIPIQEPSTNQRGGESVQNSSELRVPDETGTIPFEQLGIVSNIPKHPQLSTLERRLATFSNWPQDCRQTPEQLAAAGFVYAGFSDNVKCFFCDVGLRNWDPNDDPWVEHARWFGTCGYLRLNKGNQFIEQVRRLYPHDGQFTVPPSSPYHTPPILTSRVSEEYTRITGHQNESLEIQMQSQIDREIQSQLVQRVLSLGFEWSEVRRAIENKMRLTGCGFSHVENLVTAVIDGRRPDAISLDTPVASTASRSPCYTQQSDLSPSTTSILERPLISQIPSSLNLSSVPNVASQLSSPNTSLSLEEEYQLLKDQRMCKICMDHEVAVVFLPCGHLVCCTQCAPALRECPICRQIIRGSVRTFLS